ncbi:hypothetical protein VVD49_16235 [Uliginosibacterium sp. H3]|uniref:Transmembrane protein n=1 Tax=Uliginosibacterium silvisoli TaxID=3114758 RepID=A0ABU6K5V5_9RHOO|nr:hypothetical protein [Uliginosibacterium sp. H3]
MTDTHQQPPKKSARPNLFAPQAATRALDERISVLASLDANPPPKKKKKRGLARSTIAMLGITCALFSGLLYLAVTQPEQTQETVAVTPPPQQAAAPVVRNAASSNGSEAPSLSLSALAADHDASAPATAVIENEAGPLRDPIAILEHGNAQNTAPGNTSSAKPTPAAPATQANLLKTLNAPAQGSQANKASAQSAPVAVTRPAGRPASANPKASAPARSATPKANPVDSDVALLEGLLASSNRQEAKDRAAAKAKDKQVEAATAESGREGQAAKPQ